MTSEEACKTIEGIEKLYPHIFSAYVRWRRSENKEWRDIDTINWATTDCIELESNDNGLQTVLMPTQVLYDYLDSLKEE